MIQACHSLWIFHLRRLNLTKGMDMGRISIVRATESMEAFQTRFLFAFLYPDYSESNSAVFLSSFNVLSQAWNICFFPPISVSIRASEWIKYNGDVSILNITNEGFKFVCWLGKKLKVCLAKNTKATFYHQLNVKNRMSYGCVFVLIKTDFLLKIVWALLSYQCGPACPRQQFQRPVSS